MGGRFGMVVALYTKFSLIFRLDGKHLPLPPATNGTQWGQATMAKNIDRFCSSNNPCINAYCPEPFECVDLWNKYECTLVYITSIYLLLIERVLIKKISFPIIAVAVTVSLYHPRAKAALTAMNAWTSLV